jgi:hypothetical protein
MVETIKIHMGFVNTPYNKESMARPATAAKQEAARQRKRNFSKTMTAEKVSNILEGKYGIVDTFAAIHEHDIRALFHDQFREVATKIIEERGGQTYSSIKRLMNPATKEVEKLFKSFLDNEEMNGMVSGVPTQAAMRGVRHGRGSKTRRGIQRPSFIDTGIYRASFRCWVDR